MPALCACMHLSFLLLVTYGTAVEIEKVGKMEVSVMGHMSSSGTSNRASKQGKPLMRKVLHHMALKSSGLSNRASKYDGSTTLSFSLSDLAEANRIAVEQTEQHKGTEEAAADVEQTEQHKGTENVVNVKKGTEEEAPEWKSVQIFSGPEVTLGHKGQMHSQVGQDWLVGTLLGCKSSGFFVDLAANDAQQLSNTLMLERDFDWNGVCIEANMDYMYGLSHRKCQVVTAAVGAPKDQEVEFTRRGVFGGIIGKQFDNKGRGDGSIVSMRTVPLGDILQHMGAPANIDYFSLDVEGAESIVMQGFPWEKYRFSVITLERPKPDLEEQLTNHGYRRLRINSNFNDQTWISSKLPNFTDLIQAWGNKPMVNYPKSCMEEKGYSRPA